MSLTDQDRELVQAVVHDYLAAWNEERDPKACADCYVEDGDLLAADGVFLSSPDEIEQYYADRLGDAYKNFRVRQIRVFSLRAVRPDVAILDAAWEGYVVDDAGAPGPVIASPMGTFVVIKREHGWGLSAVRIMIPWSPA